jgi:hypothetical protein
MASTKDVLDHHLKCFGEGDLIMKGDRNELPH